MPAFGPESRRQLATCHPDLQRVMLEAIKVFDFSIVEGHRGKEKQDRAFANGASKVQWPDGKHNAIPSRAVDCAPFPIDWSDRPKAIERFVYMAGVIMATADRLGVSLRWGGDWNRNEDMRDEGPFRDYPHFELTNP
jgi:peptidoglycan L-alanyl-D-glutamate endopeptidase CwlK